jgi:hypothetical protein
MGLLDWSDDPPEGPWPKWFNGCVIPIGISLYAASVLAAGQGTLPARGRPLVVTGVEATLYGSALLGAAFFVHAHYFWGNSKSLGEYAQMGKAVGLIAFIGCVVYLAYRVIARF